MERFLNANIAREVEMVSLYFFYWHFVGSQQKFE